jgi:hypothetical protein
MPHLADHLLILIIHEHLVSFHFVFLLSYNDAVNPTRHIAWAMFIATLKLSSEKGDKTRNRSSENSKLQILVVLFAVPLVCKYFYPQILWHIL